MFGFTFTMTSTSTFSAILSLCLVVSRLHGNDAGVSGLPKNFLWFLLLLFFIRHTDTKSAGNAFDAKQTTKQTIVKKRGMALLSPKQQMSPATSQMTSSPRSPCAASSQAFSVKAFGDIAETSGRKNVMSMRELFGPDPLAGFHSQPGKNRQFVFKSCKLWL